LSNNQKNLSKASELMKKISSKTKVQKRSIRAKAEKICTQLWAWKKKTVQGPSLM